MGRDYCDVAARTTALCRSEDWQAVKELLHAFKGVAGNLGIRELPQIANALELEIKEGQPVSQSLLGELSTKVDLLLKDLKQIENLTEPNQAAVDELDIKVTVPLLQRLIAELEGDEINDDTIDQLRDHLGAERFSPIEIQLEAFEISKAAEAAKELLTLLEASCPSGVGDAQQAIPLLRKILLGLVESRIDDTALESLRASIEELRHAQLSAALDAFDFENATEITKKLLSEFGENNE
jgi:HPt (histidine-containing phosphotransfer) domain-containing protein